MPQTTTEQAATLGALVKRERVRAGMYQRELAAAVGVGEVYISQIETGHKRPSEVLISKLANALGIDRGRLTGEMAA